MRIIEPSVTLIDEKNPYKKVEAAGRTCYKSEDKIKEGSAERFTKALIRSEHTAMLEHAVFTFELTDTMAKRAWSEELDRYLDALRKDPYLHVTTVAVIVDELRYYTRHLVSGNARAISQRQVNDPIWRALREAYPDLVWGVNHTREAQYTGISAKLVDLEDYTDLTPKEIAAHKHLTFRFVTDRGVTHELVRHRPCSFAQESTRYCCYANDQFGKELTVIRPSTFDEWTDDQRSSFKTLMQCCEDIYMYSVKTGLTPQQARAMLPNAVKTEIVVTANLQEWEHIFNLRYFGTTGAPHPDIKEVIGMALELAVQDPLVSSYMKGGSYVGG